MAEHRDRILDWREELRRLEPELPDLPEAVRLAVQAVVEDFLREDASAPPAAVALEDAA